MAIMPLLKVGQLVQTTIAGEVFVGLVLATSPATRRGRSPMVKVQWTGEPPRDYRVEHVDERMLKLVQ
jgi:hypothetical protein